MHRRFERTGRLYIAVVCTMSVAACQPGARIDTAADLGAALQKEGVAYTTTQELPTPTGRHFRFDEGIALVGDKLWVEIMRIEDKRVFDLAKTASVLLTLAEASVGKKFPGKPEVYTRQPFVIVVREEPTKGQVAQALDRCLPDGR